MTSIFVISTARIGQGGQMNTSSVSDKKRSTALLLSFFLGGLGVDRFYLGYIGLGIRNSLRWEGLASGESSISFSS